MTYEYDYDSHSHYGLFDEHGYAVHTVLTSRSARTEQRTSMQVKKYIMGLILIERHSEANPLGPPFHTPPFPTPLYISSFPWKWDHRSVLFDSIIPQGRLP